MSADVGRPTRPPTLIYDAECAFCRRWVSRVKRLDRRGAIALLPRQDPSALQLSARTPEDLRDAIHLVRPDGSVFHGAAAVRELLPYLTGGKMVAILARIPGAMWLGQRAYGWIARRWGPVRPGVAGKRD
jgi:predicted DCC family thiol-disulfide oxidoreductase YuxK